MVPGIRSRAVPRQHEATPCSAWIPRSYFRGCRAHRSNEVHRNFFLRERVTETSEPKCSDAAEGVYLSALRDSLV